MHRKIVTIMKNKLFTLLFALLASVGFAKAELVQIADTYNMAQDSVFTLGAFDVVYTTGAYYYIKDASASGLIYKTNYGLQVGDHVEAGLVGKIKIYYGLYEIIPTTAKTDLTITPGEAFEPAEAYETPSASNVNQYVVYRDVTFATDTAFASKRLAVYGVWDNQSLYFYNQFMIGATLQAGKRYNITAVNGIYNTSAQAWPISVEEVNDTPEPCLVASGTCGDNLTWELSCDSVLTISGTGAMTEFYDGTPAPWSEYKNSIKSAYINNGVTSIGSRAFYGCNSLTSVTIPNGVTYIGWYAFASSKLMSITIPGSVTELGIYPFHMCSNLTAINVDSDNSNYCSVNGVLYNKDQTILIKYPAAKSATTYYILNSVTNISDFAFSWCNNLTSVNIPNSVTRIEAYAFRNCTSLTSVTIPDSVTYIGGYAFTYCNSLTSVTTKSTTPPMLASTAFHNVDISSIPLYVPAESVAAYQTADVWKDFGAILAISEEDEPQYVTIADTYNMAQDSTFILGAFDVIYVNGAYCYIKDATGYGMIYQNNYGLQAGDHVAAGMEGKINIYYGCYELTPLTAVADLTVTAGEVAAPMEATDAPSADNVNRYVVYQNVSFATDTAFVEGSRNTVRGAWNNQTIRFYNQFRIGATLQAGKTYNITAFNGINNTIIRVYPVAVEEVSGGTPTPCLTDSGTCGENLTWTLSCYGVLTISGTGAMTNFENVSANPWYTHRTSILSVIIEEGVTSIGNYAFFDCDRLTSVTIPNSVTNIGRDAFSYSNGLTSITIPNSVTNIGLHPFFTCTGLTSINVATDNPNYSSADGVLFNKDKTILIEYPVGKQESSYSIPNSVISIGDFAFHYCTGLSSVTIPQSVTSIGYSAFEECYGLTSITIPQSVTYMDERSFWNCPSLTSLTIPNSVTYIGNGVCSNCPELTSIDVALDNPNYCSIDGVLFNKAKTTLIQYPAGKQGEYVVPNSVTNIVRWAFFGCYGLTTLIIPNSVTNIGDFAFAMCTDLTAVTNYALAPQALMSYVFYDVNLLTCTLYVPAESVAAYQAANSWKDFGTILPLDEPETPCTTLSGTCGENLTWELSCDSVLTISGTGDMTNYSEGNSHSPWYIHRNTIKSLIIEDGITSIGNYSFNDCNKIDSVSIPSSVTIIGMYAFMGCKAINTITIPNGVAQIQNGAFHACNGLTSVMIPSSVVNVSHPFSMCHNLSTINVANDNPKYCSIDGVLFSKDHKKLVQYPIGRSAESYIIPDSVQQIVIAAFAACSNLSSITIPQEVTNIGIRAFYNCTNLTSVVCQAINPPTLGDNVFELVDLPSCTLHVPAESVAAYQAADGWKEFGSILPIGETQDYITIAQAIEIGMALDSMATSTEIYTVEGYVINAGTFSTRQKNQSWYMADDVYATSSSFQAYKCYPTDGVDTFAITNGYRVRMTGHLQKYYTLSTSTYTVEMKLVPATIIAEQQVADTLTIAEALAIGAELPAGGYTPVKYVIRGYVSHIDTPFDESTGFETFYIADDISTPAYSNQTGGFHIYRGSPVTGEAIAQGALVEITTAIYNYRGTIIENYGQLIPVTVIQEAPACNTLTGICGENLTWTLSTCDGLLTISGTGATYNYSKENVAPWVYYDVISAVVENGVTALGAFAFYGCSMISISIPESVSNIAFNTFNNCNNLLNFMVDPGNLAYSSVDGVLFNQDQTIIVRYPRGRQGEYTIPDGVVIVGDGAFNGCYRVTNVTIPNSVTTLGCAAFFSCGMSSITIPANVNRIDSLVFIGCQHLNVVTNYAIVPQVIDTNVFGGVIDISECTLYVPAESVAAYQAANSWKDFGTILPLDEPETPCTTLSGTCGENLTWELTCDSVLTISGTGAMTDFANRAAPWYENRLAIRTLQIGNEVTTIGTYAFTGCSELTSITLGNNITSVGQRAFRDCSNIRTVTIGKNVVALGNGVFNNCNRIEAVQWNAINFRQQKPNQDENSFPFYASRNTITSFIFGEEVEYIPAYLMKDYAAIQQITIPASVTEIGDYAFANDSFVTYMHSPIQAITCYAVTPPTVYAATFMGIDKSACTLYVPYASIGLYRNAYQWSEFFNILPIDEPVEPDPTYINVNYIDQAGNLFAAEYVTLHLPVAPIIEGFSFLTWQVVAGDLEDGIVIQAVYSANEPSSAPEVYTNPANQAQKLIRNGHVYILKDDKVYTIHGQKVK